MVVLSELGKHRNVPNREQRYMGLAWIMAGFSKDPNTQVGALIINPETNEPLGWGYNGPPAKINDKAISWSRPAKYDYMVHAEQNAIDHSCGSLEGSHVYVTHMPCKSCILRLVTKKVSQVYYMNKVKDMNSTLANTADKEKVEEIARLGDVTLTEFDENLGWLQDWTLSLKELGVFSIV